MTMSADIDGFENQFSLTSSLYVSPSNSNQVVSRQLYGHRYNAWFLMWVTYEVSWPIVQIYWFFTISDIDRFNNKPTIYKTCCFFYISKHFLSVIHDWIEVYHNIRYNYITIVSIVIPLGCFHIISKDICKVKKLEKTSIIYSLFTSEFLSWRQWWYYIVRLYIKVP